MSDDKQIISSTDEPKPIIKDAWSWQLRHLAGPLLVMIVPTGNGEGHSPGWVVDMELSEFISVLETKKWGVHELMDSDIALLKQGLKDGLKNQRHLKELVTLYDEVTKLEQRQKQAALLKASQAQEQGDEPTIGLS